jgi:hypothetical protein
VQAEAGGEEDTMRDDGTSASTTPAAAKDVSPKMFNFLK